MKILVTGGAGFIGSHIVEKLAGLGHQVIVLDNLSSGKIENLVTNAEFIEGDICNHELVTNLFRNHTFDAIFHLAAQIDVRASVANPLLDAETNILASLHLIDTAVKNGVKTFIFSSTGGVMYGDTEVRPTPETHNEHPSSSYGIGKLAIDKYLTFFGEHYPMRTVSLRYGNVYGPRQNPHGEAGVVAIFIDKMLAGINPVINGDGSQTRDYVYIEDVVNANILALENASATGIYNIGTGKETSVNTVFQNLASLFKNHFEEQHGDAKPGEQLTGSLDALRAKEELCWSPQTDLQSGLQKTYNFFTTQSS